MVPVKLTSIFLKREVEKNEGSLHISFVTDLNSEIKIQINNKSWRKKIVFLQYNVIIENIEMISPQISCSHHVIAGHLNGHKIGYWFETGNALSFRLVVEGHFWNRTASTFKVMLNNCKTRNWSFLHITKQSLRKNNK